jgi:methylenetetrahydrofolate reductase (NADPH)
MTQIVYDVGALEAWVEVVRARGVLERAAILAGVAPLRSAKQARYLDEHLPGVTVPPAMIAQLEEAGPEAEALGAEHAAAIVRRLRAVGVAGVHVMGLGREGAVRQVIERAGLLPRPTRLGT